MFGYMWSYVFLIVVYAGICVRILLLFMYMHVVIIYVLCVYVL